MTTFAPSTRRAAVVSRLTLTADLPFWWYLWHCDFSFGIVESPTRMMLHLHGFVWLAGNFGAATLYQRLKSDPVFKDRVIYLLYPFDSQRDGRS